MIKFKRTIGGIPPMYQQFAIYPPTLLPAFIWLIDVQGAILVPERELSLIWMSHTVPSKGIFFSHLSFRCCEIGTLYACRLKAKELIFRGFFHGKTPDTQSCHRELADFLRRILYHSDLTTSRTYLSCYSLSLNRSCVALSMPNSRCQLSVLR